MELFSRKVWRVVAAVVLLGALAGFIALAPGWAAFGARAEGARLARMQRSPQWGDGHFRDIMPRREPPFLETLRAWLFDGSSHRRPAQRPPVLKRSAADFARPPASGLRITWLGHSTLLIELDGKRILTDPVWGEFAAPYAFLGVDRFYAPPLPFEELPKLDAIVISHDHYDHLDYPTVQRFAEQEVPFLVPLGIGAHLEHWGIEPHRITELDWWESHHIGDIELTCTPARHFSGRGFTDREMTLWASWSLVGPKHRVFFSGDSAMFPELADIGARLGPFDVTLIESGAYNALWADVHFGPEQAVEAHRMLRGKLMLPIHWGLFDLAMHSWTEPVERVLAAARTQGVRVATPRPGESIEPTGYTEREAWWPQLPWEDAQAAPVVSSGLAPTE